MLSDLFPLLAVMAILLLWLAAFLALRAWWRTLWQRRPSVRSLFWRSVRRLVGYGVNLLVLLGLLIGLMHWNTPGS